MSRRGGRKPSAARELLKQSAKEAGVDSTAALEDITRPRLYPDFQWRSDGAGYWDTEDSSMEGAISSPKRLAKTIQLMNKQRELAARFQTVYKHLHETEDLASQSVPPDEQLLQSFSKTNRKLVNDTRYFPTDLVAEKKVKATTKTKKESVLTKLEALASKEESRVPDTTKSGLEDDEEELEPLAEDEDDHEADLDYTKDYYDTDEEEETGADDEAVF